jgi:hypothetical protein
MSKPFVEFPEFSTDFEDFDRPVYLRFKEGYPTVVRILDTNAHRVRKHWINKQKISVMCLGDTCPICENNDSIRGENPKNFRQVKGYIPVQYRYMVNVLDRTPAVIDDDSGEEYYAQQGTFPLVTADGERSLAGVEPQPSNTIKILERGKTLFENFLAIHKETGEFDGEGNLESGGLTTFDIKLVTLGAGKDMAISVIPLITNDDDVHTILEENELSTHVLTDVGLFLTADEVSQVAFSGVSLSDIFSARNADSEAESTEEMTETLADVSASVETMFADDVEEVEA